MDDYHRGFEDAVDLVEDLVAEHLIQGTNLPLFTEKIQELRARVGEHKVTTIRQQMGL